MTYERKSLLQMARGAFLEVFDAEMSKIIDNILDPNTATTQKRKLNITFTFSPDDNRQTIGVAYQCKSTLSPIKPVGTSLYITSDEDGSVTAVEMVPDVPGKISFDGSEQEAPAILKLIS